jgi:hypothetical protein
MNFARTCVLILTSLTGGCSAAGGVGSLVPSLPSGSPEFPGSPSEVYTRIARGANQCWFGPKGYVDRAYIFHARAEPATKGGGAEILVHERFEANQRGLKAFSVVIGTQGLGTGVAAENLKMPDAVGQRMSAEVHHWARGGTGCPAAPSGWQAPAPATVAAPAKPASTGSTTRPVAAAKKKRVE